MGPGPSVTKAKDPNETQDPCSLEMTTPTLREGTCPLPHPFETYLTDLC